MKTSKCIELTKTLSLIISTVVIVLCFSSCGTTKANFLSSSIVPAAGGVVTITKDMNKNYKINVKLYNLAQPDKLATPRKVYLVWMESGDENVKNIGQISIKKSILSKALNANLKAVSTIKPTKIYITADDDPTIQSPMSEVILTTAKF